MKSSHNEMYSCSCSLLQTHEKELEERRRVGSNILVPGGLCVLGWYRSRFKPHRFKKWNYVVNNFIK